MTASIAGIGSAFPPEARQDELWDGFFSAHHGGDRLAEAIWRNSGIERRHGVADPRRLDVSRWSTAERMKRFAREAMPIAREASLRCLAQAGIDSRDVELLTVVSCTGYTTPGLDILLARDLDMGQSVQRLHIGHMGCYASLPALRAVADAALARKATALLLCVELTSLHIQPPTTDLEQVVAHALFSDAAAAVAVVPEPAGLEVLEVVAWTDPSTADHMRWDVTDQGFRMTLSPDVASVLEQHIGAVVGRLLERHGLEVRDVEHWAVHPGGPRILTTVGQALGLGDEALAPSRRVLRDHGNCSSSTVLLVLQELLGTRPPSSGQHVVALAFGPGLTLYGALLRQD